jgi:hypothetical protein
MGDPEFEAHEYATNHIASVLANGMQLPIMQNPTFGGY